MKLRRLPEPTTKGGALFYSIVGGLTVSLVGWLVVFGVTHVHITISWR